MESTEVSLHLCLRVAALRGTAGVSLHLGVPFFYVDYKGSKPCPGQIEKGVQDI